MEGNGENPSATLTFRINTYDTIKLLAKIIPFFWIKGNLEGVSGKGLRREVEPQPRGRVSRGRCKIIVGVRQGAVLWHQGIAGLRG